MKVLICGGRDFGHVPYDGHPEYIEKKRQERQNALAFLDKHLRPLIDEGLVVIHGGARGGDSIADEWARANLPEDRIRVHRADWNKHGKKAGPIRNREMYDAEKPDQIWAFPGGKGTDHMCSIGLKGGCDVRKIRFK